MIVNYSITFSKPISVKLAAMLEDICLSGRYQNLHCRPPRRQRRELWNGMSFEMGWSSMLAAQFILLSSLLSDSDDSSSSEDESELDLLNSSSDESDDEFPEVSFAPPRSTRFANSAVGPARIELQRRHDYILASLDQNRAPAASVAKKTTSTAQERSMQAGHFLEPKKDSAAGLTNRVPQGKADDGVGSVIRKSRIQAVGDHSGGKLPVVRDGALGASRVAAESVKDAEATDSAKAAAFGAVGCCCKRNEKKLVNEELNSAN
ncbi:hypothetical protein R1sor_026812 [Riccia sorocarpa]|uniref:Uncharacterized protein n=1 Tax=Riccia sorocarpa TaxID=122646 RepID=A0ABD3GI83_9MARC